MIGTALENVIAFSFPRRDGSWRGAGAAALAYPWQAKGLIAIDLKWPVHLNWRRTLRPLEWAENRRNQT